MTILSVVLSSCADDNLKQPTELQPFDTTKYLERTWYASIGAGPDEQYVFLRPLKLGDKLVTASRDGVISVFRANSGDMLDQFELDTTLSAGVGGDKEVWLVASRDAHIIAIDARTLTERWRTRVPTEVLARPQLHQGKAIVRTVDGKILGLDLLTGKIRWQYQRAIPDLTLRGANTPLITRDRIIAGLADGRLIALSPDNGEVIWDIALAVPSGRSEIQRLVDIDGDAVLYGRVLYAASYQGRIAAIDVSRGNFLWAKDFSSHNGLVVEGDALYSSDENGHVWAIDRLNGATLWKQDKLAYRDLTRPTVMGDYLVVGDFEGYIHVLSRYDGHFVARYQLSRFDDEGWPLAAGIILPPLAIDADSVLAITRGGMAYQFELRDRQLEFDF